MSYISATVKKDKVMVWERTATGERIRRWFDAPYYFYVDDPNGKHRTIFDTPVTKLTFKNVWEYREARQQYERKRISTGINAWESDISPELRVLSTNYYNKPINPMNTTFMDIEVDYDPEIGFSSPEDPYAPINAISMFHRWTNTLVVFCVPPPGQVWTEESLLAEMNRIEPIPEECNLELVLCEDERELLMRTAVSIDDTDVWCGYNSDLFDFPYIFKRAEIVLEDIGGMDLFNFNDAPSPRFQEVEVFGRPRNKVQMTGRALLDYMELIRKFEPGERESYKLAAMEEEKELNLPKLSYTGTLADLYRDNFALFIRYNIRDAEILEGFERKLKYVEVANTYVHMATGFFDHVFGTLKLAELTLINHCHFELQQVVPNNRMPLIDRSIQGAYVVDPVPNFYEWVGSVDLTSLYPSCMRATNSSPETIVGQFTGEFDDSESLFMREDKYLTLEMIDGKTLTLHVNEWVKWITENEYAVSGFGVVFDQKRIGIVPSVLTNWFQMRIHYKTEMKRFAKLRDNVFNKADGMTFEPNPKFVRDCNGIPYQLNAEFAQEHDEAQAGYDNADRLQYIYKIRLNSLYGALGNQMFRFYDLRVAESTTATGRMVARHQRAQVNLEMHGKYVDEGLAILYGDTDSAYFKIDLDSDAPVEDQVRRADEIAKAVNESFPAFMKRAFFCNEENSKIMGSAREVVMDTVIFIVKKRYIGHIVDSEGKRVDKFKAMGIDLIKSSLPRETSLLVQQLVHRLLKREPWEVVAEDTVKLKAALRKQDVITLGLPKGVNNIENYTRALKADKKTRLPGHVSAAILYNQKLDEFADKVSPRIVSGMKIKVFYLKKPDGRFKSIAIPTDIEVVPAWFRDIEIDINAQIVRLVDRPFENIIRAIGKEAPTRQTILIDDMFDF